MTINKVVPSTSESGGGSDLQPAAPLSPEIRQQLFDEFATTTPAITTESAPVHAQAIFVSVILAGVLAYTAFYVLRQVRPHED